MSIVAKHPAPFLLFFSGAAAAAIAQVTFIS